MFAFFAGLMAFWLTPREENPQIVVPAANIIVAKPGASPEEVEQLIVKPLEAILQGMSGIDHTYGVAAASVGVVSVQFEVGEDKEDSLVKLYDRIMSNLDRMPPGTRQPLVKPVDVDDVPANGECIEGYVQIDLPDGAVPSYAIITIGDGHFREVGRIKLGA